MGEKLNSIWPILARDGVGDAIGDARPAFVVTPDGRFLHFANAAGARFLNLAPARALEARLTLEPRLADRLVRFAATARQGDTSRELLRFFDGLRSSLLSVGFRRLADDAVFVTVDNARTDPADADPAASLEAIAAEGGLVALFDRDGEVAASLGDHAALDGVQDEIEAALDAEDGDPVFDHRVEAAGRAHRLTLVRLGDAEHPRRLLRVGPAETIAAPAPTASTAPTPVSVLEVPAAVTAPPHPETGHADAATVATAATAAAAVAPVTDTATTVRPEIPEAVVPPAAFHGEEATEDLAEAIAAVTGTPPTDTATPATDAPSPAATALLAEIEAVTPRPSAPIEGATETVVADETTLAVETFAPPEIVEAGETTPVGISEIEVGEFTAAAPAEDAAAETSEDTVAAPPPAGSVSTFRRSPIGRAVKFVWQMDAERRFTLVSDEFATAVGPRAAAIVGRSWREVADDFGLDGDGRVATALDRRDTWSGRTVLWPIEGEALRLPVDLAALPAFDRGHVFAGYRGFGTVRGEEAIPDPTATGLRLAAVAVAAEAPALAVATPPATPLALAAPPAGSGIAPETEIATETEIAPEIETADFAPPSYPDDSEVALVEATHPHVAEPAPDAGEAAFAGEIDIDRPVRAIMPSAMPDVWFDDELALAMATLPACSEGGYDEDVEAPSRPVVEEPATDTAEPTPITAATAEAADESLEGATPATALRDGDTSTQASLDADAAAADLLDDGASEAEPLATVPHAAGPAPNATAVIEDAPAAPLAPHAEEARLAAAALFAADEGEGESEAATPAAEPVTSSRESRLAQAPATLRAAVAAIEARAAELESHGVSVTDGDHDGTTAAHVGDAVADETAPTTETAATRDLAAPEPDAAADDDLTVAEREPAGDATTARTDEGPSTLAEDDASASPAPDHPAIATAPAKAVATPVGETATRIVALAATTRPPVDAASLSQPERVAFRQIAEALGARIEGENVAARTAPVASKPTGTATEAPPVPSPSAASEPASPPAATIGATPAAIVSHDTRLLDGLPGAVAVVKDDNLAYGNAAFLRLLGYPDLATLEAEGGLDSLFAGEHVARRWKVGPDGSRPVPVLTRDGRVVPVDAQVATIPWAGGSALMLTLAEVEVAEETGTVAPPATGEAADREIAAPAETLPAAAASLLAEPTPPEPAVSAPTTTEPATAMPGTIDAAAMAPAALADVGLRERVAELEAIIDTATDGVLMLDAEGTILSANHAAEALFGTDRADMIGRSLTDRLAPESRRSAMDYLDGLTRNGVASVLNDGREVIGVVERGGLIPLFMTIGRISADPSRKYCAVLRDITHWKKSEEDLTAARRRAEEASVHKSDFLAKISHEIRTPLNAIIGFSEVMMDERFGPIGNERYKDYLRDIHSSGSHIMSLINDLLDLSKVEAGKMDLRFEAVALGDIMAECVAMMQPQANRERIIIRSSLPAGIPPVVADPRSVRQVMLNLLSNAIKFTPSGGQVIVSTTLEDSGEVVMRVRDTGYGMTEKELQTAMEPFRQLHTTRSRGGGTGLGLPLTKALVEANRAVLRIDSTVGQGTLVTVTFPVTRVLAS